MAAEDARMKAGLKTAEDELNLIKNQVQQTLLDIREHILDVTNPFNAIDDALTDEDDIEFDDLMGGGTPGAAGAAGAAGGGGGGGGGGGKEDSGGGDDSAETTIEEDGHEEIIDDGQDDLGEEIIEEIPDDGYIEEEIIDDGGGGGGGGMAPAMSEPTEYFEEEEEVIPEEVEEEFEPDEDPADKQQDTELDDSVSAEDGVDAAVDGATGTAGGALATPTANFDVLTMAGLVRWVAVTTARLGANRTEIMLDAFEAAGRIAPSTRIVLHHLMALTEEDPAEPVPVREIVAAMVRMEGVLDSAKSTDSTRLLSMLMDVDVDPLDLIA